MLHCLCYPFVLRISAEEPGRGEATQGWFHVIRSLTIPSHFMATQECVLRCIVLVVLFKFHCCSGLLWPILSWNNITVSGEEEVHSASSPWALNGSAAVNTAKPSSKRCWTLLTYTSVYVVVAQAAGSRMIWFIFLCLSKIAIFTSYFVFPRCN